VKTLLDLVREERAKLIAPAEAVIATAETEARNLTADEFSAVQAAKAAAAPLDERIAELTDLAERSFAAAKVLPAVGGAKVTREVRTYGPHNDPRRTGAPLLSDLIASREGDLDAMERIRAHRNEERVERGIDGDRREQRNVTANFSGLVVPQYLTDLVAPAARAMRPFADICTQRALPADGMTVNISRVTTGTSAAVQAAELDAVSNTAIDDTLLTVDVRTIAGQQTLSRQAVDRGIGTEDVTLSDLVRAHDTQLDSQIINGAGTLGTHRGVRNVVGIVSVTYTSGSPTAAAAYPALFNLVSQVQSGVFMGVSHFVMHPRRWWWFVAAVGTSFPFLQQFQTAPQQAGGANGTGTYSNGPAGVIAGVPVILDGNIPTNLGAGTNEDVILGVTSSELHLWTDPAAPLFLRIDAVSTLGVTYSVYSYTAFTAGRYPGAHGTIGGTGLATPTF